MNIKPFLALFLLSLPIFIFGHPVETFSESLLIRRLSKDHYGARFQFTHRKKSGSSANHFHTFPKAIGQAMNRNISEVRLVMSRGVWRWGSETMWPSFESGAPGVEIWSKMDDIDTNWVQLIRAFAGITCSSLDILEKNFGRVGEDVVFGMMPSETVCTENLSVWLKLLPCRSKAGLAKIISPFVVFNSEYYSISLSLHQSSSGIELIQSLSMVRKINSKLISVASLFELKDLSDQFSNVCGVSSLSELVIEGPQIGSSSFSIPPQYIDRSLNSFAYWKLPLERKSPIDIAGLETLSIFEASEIVSVSKWQTGLGDISGSFSTAIYNHHPTKDLRVRHFEILPSFLRPKLGTLKIFIGDEEVEAPTKFIRNITSSLVRGPPATFEFEFNLPKNGKRVLLTYKFEKAFLFFYEFPPHPTEDGMYLLQLLRIIGQTSSMK